MKKYQQFLDALPYGPGFLFVDGFTSMDEDKVEGYYHFGGEEYFYAHHFKDHPITPGVVLIECMAQIGLMGLGMFIERERLTSNLPLMVMTDTEVIFHRGVPRGTSVVVKAKKIYYRMGKLKVSVEMKDESESWIAVGTLSGMLKINENGE
jgi:3-hydroxyacyl-[acyl-carrier-protein] dehydratase